FRELGTLAEEITYCPPSNTPLAKISEQMRVVGHVSPDSGWPQLESFLSATKRRLVIGMYDFGAPHIAAAVKAAGKKSGFQHLTLVMQHGEDIGSGTKEDDLTDDEVVKQLRESL